MSNLLRVVLMMLIAIPAFVSLEAQAKTKRSTHRKVAHQKKTAHRKASRKNRGWVRAKKKHAPVNRYGSLSRKADRNPAAVRRDIASKYARLKQELREKQARREEALMRSLENESRVAIRMENLRALQTQFSSEQAELDLQENTELCQTLNAQCDKVPGMQLAGREHVPEFAQDTGFRDE